MLCWHFHPGGKPHCTEQMLQTGSFMLILCKYAYLLCSKINSQQYISRHIYDPPKEFKCKQNWKVSIWFADIIKNMYHYFFSDILNLDLFIGRNWTSWGRITCVFSLVCYEPVGLTQVGASTNIYCAQRLKTETLKYKNI